MNKFDMWVDLQTTKRINMKRLNTGPTAVIRIDVHFEPRDTDSEPAF